ncbi:MAG: DUF481 domain-containing protein [Bacteroidota bacterium]|nr:DUF481 domain-containing protein [Bacteroidota bacterium]
MTAFAQKDTVIMKQGDRLAGDITSVLNDVLTLKTDYASTPLSLKWTSIVYLESNKHFKIIDKNGLLYLAKIGIDYTNKGKVAIITDTTKMYIAVADVDQITNYENLKFADKFKLSVDVGYSRAKNKSSQQISIGLKLAYEAKRWDFGLNYYSYASVVDTAKSSRGNLDLTLKYILPKNWFLIAQAGLYANTEQLLDSRETLNAGIGRFISRNSSQLFFYYIGATKNREKYTGSPDDFHSAETFGTIHYEYSFPKGISTASDLSLYKSLTESGRFRSTFRTDLNLAFSTHFRTGFNLILNTDNKPPVTSNKTDYILNLKFGWML